MFGSLFLLPQYLQFVLGYDPLQAGIRLLPLAVTLMVVAPNSARLVERFGTKAVVGSGLERGVVGGAAAAEVVEDRVDHRLVDVRRCDLAGLCKHRMLERR